MSKEKDNLVIGNLAMRILDESVEGEHTGDIWEKVRQQLSWVPVPPEDHLLIDDIKTFFTSDPGVVDAFSQWLDSVGSDGKAWYSKYPELIRSMTNAEDEGHSGDDAGNVVDGIGTILTAALAAEELYNEDGVPCEDVYETLIDYIVDKGLDVYELQAAIANQRGELYDITNKALNLNRPVEYV